MTKSVKGVGCGQFLEEKSVPSKEGKRDVRLSLSIDTALGNGISSRDMTSGQDTGCDLHRVVLRKAAE